MRGGKKTNALKLRQYKEMLADTCDLLRRKTVRLRQHKDMLADISVGISTLKTVEKRGYLVHWGIEVERIHSALLNGQYEDDVIPAETYRQSCEQRAAAFDKFLKEKDSPPLLEHNLNKTKGVK